MKLNVYSIKDIKVNSFNTAFLKAHDALAVRDVETVANDENSQLNKYPQDFELWKIGEFNQDTGQLNNLEMGCIMQVHSLIHKSTESQQLTLDEGEKNVKK